MNVGDREDADRHRAKRIKDNFIASSAHMAKSISDWVDQFKRIPVELMEEEFFRVGSQIGKRLLGVDEDKGPGDEDIVATLTQAKAAKAGEEEYSPQWIAEMEVLMQAYDKKKSITADFDRPSFILPGFPDGFFDTQPTDRPEPSSRAEAAGTSCQTNLNAGDNGMQLIEHPLDPSQEPLVMTDVEFSDEEDDSVDHHFAHTFNDGSAQRDSPSVNKAGGNVLSTSTEGGRSRSVSLA